MLIRSSALPMLVLTLYSVPATPQSAGGIDGIVVNESNQAVPGAIVTAVRQAPLGGSPVSAFTQTAGAFMVSNLPPGNYVLCLQAPRTTYLNPCHWQKQPPTVAVAAGLVTRSVLVKLTAGSALKVRLSDPTRFLSKRSTPGAPLPSVLLMVATPGGFYQPLSEIGTDTTGSDLEIPVPFDTPVRVFVYSGQLALRESTGAALPLQGATLTFEQKKKDGPKPAIRIDVTGFR